MKAKWSPFSSRTDTIRDRCGGERVSLSLGQGKQHMPLGVQPWMPSLSLSVFRSLSLGFLDPPILVSGLLVRHTVCREIYLHLHLHRPPPPWCCRSACRDSCPVLRLIMVSNMYQCALLLCCSDSLGQYLCQGCVLQGGRWELCHPLSPARCPLSLPPLQSPRHKHTLRWGETRKSHFSSCAVLD